MSRDLAYLLDILLMAKDARDFTRGLDKKTFLSDRQCQYAVIRCLEVMGAAAKRVSDDARKKYPDVPWAAMGRMRDLLIHAYGRVNLNEVWDTVQRDIPPLVSVLERIVPPEDQV
jgi:uncharacterized protein with HEPN domain